MFKSQASQIIWSNIFKGEFFYDRNIFPDVDQNEKIANVFKTCFVKYKHIRSLLKDLLSETKKQIDMEKWPHEEYDEYL